jgi:hypothetical protein
VEEPDLTGAEIYAERGRSPALGKHRPGRSPRHAVAPGVIGTPTYLLDDAVISLGNPAWDELLRRLAAAVDDG